MTRSRAIFLLLAFLFLALYFLLRQEAVGPLTRTRIMMGTVVEIRVYDDAAEQYDDAVSAAFAEMETIEELMSPHRPASDVSRLSAADTPIAVSTETLEVLQLAQDVSAASHGAFAATLGRLINLWGFAEGEAQLPALSEIEKALAEIGPAALTFQGNKITKSSAALAIDLGGVAKGYAIDRAITVLAASGIQHASVNAGGDMRLLGDRAGAPWRIGIQHPRQTGAVLASLKLADRAVVTSGDYERFFEQDGVRYHHILDPRSGYPARLCQSVTVVAEQAALADAVATAAFVLGPELGMVFLRETEGVDGLIVAADGSIEVTPGLQELIEWP